MTETQTQLESATPCPICGQADKMNQPKWLYGQPVCFRCWKRLGGRRCFAWMIDIVIIYLICMALASINKENMQLPFLIMFLFKDSFFGYSPGKWLLGLRVIGISSGMPGGFIMSLKRNLPLLIPFMPIWVATELYKGIRTGDKWADSMVVLARHEKSEGFAAHRLPPPLPPLEI